MKDVPNRKQGNGDELKKPVDVWTVWLWETCPAEIDERNEELMEKGDKEERNDDGNNGGKRGGWKNAEGITERQERKEDERKAEASARSHLLYIRQGRVLLYLLPHDDVCSPSQSIDKPSPTASQSLSSNGSWDVFDAAEASFMSFFLCHVASVSQVLAITFIQKRKFIPPVLPPCLLCVGYPIISEEKNLSVIQI